jgi:carbamoyl-phosphate synthase large subunit
MRSTGEVMGISDSFGGSFAKASIAAGMPLPQSGTVLFSLNDNDKGERAANIARSFVRLGFSILATEGTSKFLTEFGIANRPVLKAGNPTLNVIDVIRNGWLQLVVLTPFGQTSREDEHSIGRTAMEYKVPFITTLAAAASAAKSIEEMKKNQLSVMSVQEHHEIAAQGGEAKPVETLEDCARMVEYIRSFQM